MLPVGSRSFRAQSRKGLANESCPRPNSRPRDGAGSRHLRRGLPLLLRPHTPVFCHSHEPRSVEKRGTNSFSTSVSEFTQTVSAGWCRLDFSRWGNPATSLPHCHSSTICAGDTSVPARVPRRLSAWGAGLISFSGTGGGGTMATLYSGSE